MNGLDLFSGIGGLSFALKEWVRPIAYCEIDPYCQGVLLSRMAEGDLAIAPIWDDISTFPVESFTGETDIIYGGFPCQDISIAGNGKGLEGERSGLFFEIMRLAKEIKPKFIFLENVPAITNRGGFRVIKEIASLGYDCRWCVVSAQETCNALHERKRWFLLAYANSESSIKTDTRTKSKQEKRKTRLRSARQNWRDVPNSYWQKNQSPIIGVDDDLPFRMDRAKALGNSVCIEQAKTAFKILMGIDD